MTFATDKFCEKLPFATDNHQKHIWTGNNLLPVMKRWQIVTNWCITFHRFSDKSYFSSVKENKIAKIFAYFNFFYYLCVRIGIMRCGIRRSNIYTTDPIYAELLHWSGLEGFITYWNSVYWRFAFDGSKASQTLPYQVKTKVTNRCLWVWQYSACCVSKCFVISA